MTMEEMKSRNATITFLVIGALIAIAAIISGLVWIVVSMLVTNTLLSLGISLFIGITIWTIVLFATSLFDMCFINGQPNWAIILSSQIAQDKIPEAENERAEMFELSSMREVYHGWYGKWPWEQQFDSVNLNSEILLGSLDGKGPLICYTSDDIELAIDWQVVLTPLRGYLQYLVRKDEKAALAYFRGVFEQKITSWVKGKKEKEVFDALDDLKEVFKNTLGGPDTVHNDEKAYGLFSNLPQIVRVNRSAAYQKSAEGKKVGSNMAEIIASLQGASNGAADPNLTMAVAAATAGQKLEGVLIIPGFNEAKALGALLGDVASHGVKASGSNK